MSLHNPVRGVPLARQVADQVQDMIVSGQWRVGEKIPAEHDLVRLLGVSRNTVREALRSLVHARLLEARVGDGTYVRSASALESPLVDRARRGGAAETIEVRAILEQHAARLAALRRTPGDLDTLHALLAALRDTDPAADAFATADAALHRAIVAAAHNDLLTEVYDHLGSALPASVGSVVHDESSTGTQQHNHVALVAAIAAADPDRAQRAAAALVDAALVDAALVDAALTTARADEH